MRKKLSWGNSHLRSVRSLVFELISDGEKLRKIEKEIGITGNRTQISFLMASRSELLEQIKMLRQEISSSLAGRDESDLRLFRLICAVLNTFYGLTVGETILVAFEKRTGLPAMEIVENPVIFETVLVGALGGNAASKITTALIAEIDREFGLSLGKKISFKDTVQLAKSSTQLVAKTLS